jgi:choline-sulfatase
MAARRIAAVIAVTLAVVTCRGTRTVKTPAVAVGRPIVFVTVDTLRADRLGSYGSTRGLTPALDRFAQAATRFSAAVTQVPLTLAAHTTMLTGLHPSRHGVRTNDGFRPGPGLQTLAEVLHTRGYATAAFIGGYPLDRSFGLSRGFDWYDDQFLRQAGTVERPADEVIDAALVWIDQHRSDRFFAWTHLFDPHSPYTPPPPFAAAHRDIPYDGEVAYTDTAIGRFFDRLQQLDLFTRSTIIVVADHGESLGEHGERTHGTFLYDATVRVPLLVKLPDRREPGDRNQGTSDAVGIVDTPVETADLSPTIAALAGASIGAVDGQNLLPLIQGARGDPDRATYAETYYQNVLLGWSPLRAVRTRRWKFVEAPRPELYDLERDPGELKNRLADHAALAESLKRTLPAQPDSTPAGRANQPTIESAERLRALGYVSGSTVAASSNGAIDPKDRVAVWASIEDGIDQMSRDPDAAERSFTRALTLDRGNGLAMKYLADLSFRRNRLVEARDEYRRALAAGFRHADVFVNLASIAERGGRDEEARAMLGEAVQLNAGDADAWNRLGLLEARRGAAAAARTAFARAMAAAPDRAEPYYNLAIIERRAGNEQLAQARLRDAVARNRAYPEAQYELGTGYLAAKDPARALDAYRAALAARPDYAEALFGAARAALDLGRTADAQNYYERFIRAAPPEYRQQVAAAREALRRLR